MRVIAALLAVKVHRRIAAAVFGRLRRSVFALKTLLSRPGFDQCSVHGEVFFRQQALLARLLQHLLEERLRDVAFQQPLAVLGEHRHVPHRIVHVQAHEPAVQQVVIQLLHQLPFAADGVEHLQQQRPQQLLGRYRGPAPLGVQRAKARRQIRQHLIHHLPQRSQRVVLRDPLLRRDVAEHSTLLLVVASHKT